MDNSGKLPQIPSVGSKPKGPKDASKDPNAKHYAIVLRAGAGHQAFTFSMDNDTSACVAALFLAMRDRRELPFPARHPTFEHYLPPPWPLPPEDMVRIFVERLSTPCSRRSMGVTNSSIAGGLNPVNCSI